METMAAQLTAVRGAMAAAKSLDISVAVRWHLVFTKPNGEEVAKANLERQGYRVYYPRVQQKVLRRGACREAISALFPRYLFVQVNTATQSLAPMRSTLGVSNVVRFGTEYVVVPKQVVDDLIGLEDQYGLHRLSLVRPFEVGSAVRVVDGALAGIEGIFECEDGGGRVVILLKMLGRETRINLTEVTIVSVSSSR
jgi:transcriptional antiterminator RfaH